jgi:hypothetical protein
MLLRDVIAGRLLAKFKKNEMKLYWHPEMQVMYKIVLVKFVFSHLCFARSQSQGKIGQKEP